jgi:hypothetical protein
MSDFVIHSWEHLRAPDIDPLGFPEELPQHLREVSALAEHEAETAGKIADFYARNAGAFKEYVDYMNSAGVDPEVIAELVAANETVEGAQVAFRDAARQFNDAADLVQAAYRAAESKYGDFDMPRFDKANAS